jgi:DNA-binding response OmpR family regulator
MHGVILAVTADELMRHSLRDALTPKGFELVWATGEDAMRVLDHHDVGVALIDRVLPDTDGLSLLWCIRADYPQIPIVLMTSDVSIRSVIEAVRMGAADYLVQPFDAAAVISTITNVLSVRPGADP